MYSIDPLTRSVKDKGGDGTVKVTTATTCPWTAVSNAPWVQLKGETSGTGSHDVKYEVGRNQSDASRTATITIAGLPHLIVQDAGD